MRPDNYRIQANQAIQRFLTYDQSSLIQKFSLHHHGSYLYVNFLCQPYRIHRRTGLLEKAVHPTWVRADSFHEVMTILDLLCGSQEDRHLANRWKSMESFGLMFHRNLLENQQDPWAISFQNDPKVFRQGCLALDGLPIPGADLGYAISFFDGMRVAVQFWFGDDEFCPRLRYLWDENALQYIRYETMHYAIPLVLQRIQSLGQSQCQPE